MTLSFPPAPVGSHSWATPPPPTGVVNRNIVAAGDSISLTGGVLQTYVTQLAALITATGKVVRYTRCGISGASWNFAWSSAGYALTMIQDALVRVDPKKAGVQNYLIGFAGTNGFILAGHTEATEYTDFQTWLSARLSAGWAAGDIYIPTMLPRTGDVDATRAAYNADLVAGVSTYGYKIVRLDLDPNIGPDGADTNTTYFLDGIHPTYLGHSIIAQLIFNVIP